MLDKEFGIADPEMPPCDAIHLIEYLFEAGPVQSGGMGQAPLSHAEIDAWQRNTGIVLDAWEARMLRRLSAAYLAESQHAAQPGRPAPWDDAPYAELNSAIVALAMKKSMRELNEL